MSWSQVIAAGMSMLEGRRQRDYGKDITRMSMNQAQKQFDAQMDESVTRRVADAKTAGIHPLFALGASVGASPTISYSGTSPSGRSSGADTAAQIIAGIPMQNAAVKAAEAAATRDHAEALYLDSLAARQTQDLASQGRDVVGSGVTHAQTFGLPDRPVLGPAEYFAPEVPFSNRPGVASGVHPAKIDVRREDGRTITIPNPGIGMDEIGQVEYVVKNARMWSTDRIEAIADWVKDDSPSNADVKRLEEQLRMWKERPDDMRQAEQLQRQANRKLAEYWRRFHNWYRR